MAPIEIKAKIGPDGVLTLSIPVGPDEADREVRVTVESVEPGPRKAADMTPEEWRQFVERMAGSIPDPDFFRHEQGEYERRDDLS